LQVRDSKVVISCWRCMQLTDLSVKYSAKLFHDFLRKRRERRLRPAMAGCLLNGYGNQTVYDSGKSVK
jgi:hypothetical protein